MDYSFNVQIACKYGVESAVLIHNLYWWVAKNMANDKHYYDGRYWTYNSQDAFQKLFPFWTKRQLRYVFDKLKNDKVILVGNYNKIPMDRTAWYSLNDDVMEIYGSAGGFVFGTSKQEDIDEARMQKVDDLQVTDTHTNLEEDSALKNDSKTAENAHVTKVSNACDKNVTMQVTKVSHASDKSVTCIDTSYKPINKLSNNQSNNQEYKDINSSIYPLPQDRLMEGTNQSCSADGSAENAQAKEWYKHWLLEKFGESDYEQLQEIRPRFTNLVNDIAKQDSIAVGGIPIKSEEILSSFVSLFSEGGNPLLEAYDIVIDKIASGTVKNQFKYTVSTLYNASRAV